MGKILSYYIMPHPPIIIPEIGEGEEIKIKETTDSCLQVASEISILKPDTIIIVTPHGPIFRDAVALTSTPFLNGDMSSFRAPQVKFNFKINLELTDKIINYALQESISTIGLDDASLSRYNLTVQLDHGASVPLYFVNKKYSDYTIVHITYGMLPKLELYKFGAAIQKAVEDSSFDSVMILSGDLSHRLTKDGPYEYSPFGEIFDEQITSLLKKPDVMAIFNMDRKTIECAGECGLRSFYIGLGAMDCKNILGDLLSYQGPFGVGYGVLKYTPQPGFCKSMIEELEDSMILRRELRKQNEDEYVSLARNSLQIFVNTNKYLIPPANLPDDMLQSQRGVFVSLHKDGELRGCIGTILPTTGSIAEEIIRNSVEAGFNDPRFSPVEPQELDDLEISVDVLMPPEKCTKMDLNEKKYGVIVRSGSRSGLLLPDLESVDSVDEQIAIALQKAGISPEEEYSLERFQVIRHDCAY